MDYIAASALIVSIIRRICLAKNVPFSVFKQVMSCQKRNFTAPLKFLHCRNEWLHAGPSLLAYIDRLSYGSEFEKALRQFTLALGHLRPQKFGNEAHQDVSV